MKHTLKITLLLLLLFIASHVIGLYVTNYYLPPDSKIEIVGGITIEKPQLDEKTSYIPIFIAILIATGLALVLIRFEAMNLWRMWFFLSVLFTLTISFAAFTRFIPFVPAFIVPFIPFTFAAILATFKVFRPTPIIHNFTELFIYGALAALFVPVLNLLSVSILLILISIYDMIAVWRTKHMISMARFQAKSRMFTGLMVPYSYAKSAQAAVSKTARKSKAKVVEAILGGGDIAFPLLFSGVILKLYGFLPALLISFCVALSLLALFLIAEKKKFYPAMPFVTAGCFLGYLVLKLFWI